MDALAAQIQDELCGTANPVIPDLQVDGRMIPNPTPPAIDVYPGDPFAEAIGFGRGNKELYFTVRARVSTADSEGGQDLLLSMMDTQATTSVEQAILAAPTLGGVANVRDIEGPTGYGLFPDSSPEARQFLGCTWRVRVIP
jgi:hypothetical protein